MPLANLEKVCLFLTAVHVLLNKASNAETFTLGYITGSKRRTGDLEYQRPGFRISGALTLAIEEVNVGELGKRGHKLDFLIAETYGEEETSILMTADLWTRNVSAYIGPQETCVHEGRMAAAFNIPMISYFCTHYETSRKDEFPTFARTRPPDTQISKSVVSVLQTFNWTRVTFMYMNSSRFEFNNKMSSIASTILTSLRSSGIIVNYLRCWNEPYHVTHMNNPFHDLISSSYRETRIYVILGNYYEHMGLLVALEKRKLFDKGEYWVVGVDIEQYDENQPDKYLRGLWQKETDISVLKAYKSYFSIVASAPIGFDNFTRLINDYRQKPPFNYRNPLANVGGIVQIVPETAYLYDAVHLYERALLLALDEKRDPRNGTEIVATMHGVHYKSAMGYMVYMDKNGDAEGNYTLIALDDSDDRVPGLYPIAHFVGKEESTRLPKLRLTRQISWIGNGPPLAEPYCGYHGEKCNSHTGEIVGGVVGGLFLVLAAIFLVIYRNWRYEQELDSLLWKVNYKDIQIRGAKSEVSIGVNENSQTKSNFKPIRTSQVSLSSNPDADFRYSMIYTEIGFYKGRTFAVKKVRKKSIEITREMKKELKIMRDLRHDNLNAFIGACTEPPNICIVVEYCPRGSLKDILENEDMKLDNMFMASLVGDIIRGMIYLHESIIKYHGSLRASNCLVDSRWVVKLADFGLREFKRDAECEPDKVMKKCQGLLYRAPELLRSTKLGEPSVRDYQKGDVYSFSIVLYELYGRHGPFGFTELSVSDILKKIITRVTGEPPFRPPLEQLENCFDFVRDCLVDCWSEDSETRPDFRTIRNRLRPLRKGMKPNIFDNMIAMMEKYANNLEALVDERTDQLTEEKKKTDALLYEMLPRCVAEQLKRGNKVEAEGFDCVTIYFSDIVGFTKMSAESSPLQVVDFLNDLYTCFDSTIENYDVYKVETIGDAYMVCIRNFARNPPDDLDRSAFASATHRSIAHIIPPIQPFLSSRSYRHYNYIRHSQHATKVLFNTVSGLPIRNGINHAGEIASMSLCLLDAIKQFSIRHRPLEKLQLRIGLHSGPVCAGVVGLKMPRYCLFGDTVNTASRMESTGSPCFWSNLLGLYAVNSIKFFLEDASYIVDYSTLKIHCSRETKRLLDKLGGFRLIERGVVTIKGKGDRLTYWLIGENSELKESRWEERMAKRNGMTTCNKKNNDSDPHVPRSSLKNKSLTRTTFLRCSSESPKRLRFASTDQLDQKDVMLSEHLESIEDNSPCKLKAIISPSIKCMESSARLSSNSCPCVEKLCNVDDKLQRDDDNSEELRNIGDNVDRFVNEEEENLCLVRNSSTEFTFDRPKNCRIICRSAPNSPRQSSELLDSHKREAQSIEEIDGWDITPLIGTTNCVD